MTAKYTIVLKTLLDDPPSREKINDALSKYPLYEPEKRYDTIPDRDELNRKLLNHYKYREIGFETFGRFLDELEITMDEIMPRYNELLKTVVTMANLPNPFDNVDVVETFEEERNENAVSDGTTTETTTSDGTTTETTTSDGTTTETTSSEGSTTTKTTSVSKDTTTMENEVESLHKGVESTTPQNEINIPAKNIDTITYADKVSWGKDNSNSNGTTTSNSDSTVDTTGTSKLDNSSTGTSKLDNSSTGTSKLENSSNATTKHTFTKKGNQGVNTYAHDMLEFRTSIIDVVDQIISDPRVAELFMSVY